MVLTHNTSLRVHQKASMNSQKSSPTTLGKI